MERLRGNNYRRMTPDDMKAIGYVLARAQDLQRDFPQIAEDYIGGQSCSQIVKNYQIIESYNCMNEKIAISIVRRALSGNHNNVFRLIFDGLLSGREYYRISKEHQRLRGSIMGTILKNEQRGFFGMSNEERSRIAKETGTKLYREKIGMFSRDEEQISRDSRIGGNRAYELGVGIHAMSIEEKREAGKKGGPLGGRRGSATLRRLGTGIFGLTLEQRTQISRRNIIAKGQIPWEDEEVKYALELSKMEKFRCGSQTNNKKIAEEINRCWHSGREVRSSNSISCALRRRFSKH